MTIEEPDSQHVAGHDEERRFALRRNSTALTRTQWTVVGVALGVAVARLIVAVVLRTGIGVVVSTVATLTAILVSTFGVRS